MGEVGLRRDAGAMDLRGDHLPLRAVLEPPGGDMPLKRAELDRLIATGAAFHQQPEEGLGLQGRVALELRDDPGPLLREGVRVGAIGAGLLHLAGDEGGPLVLPGRPEAHPRCGRRLLLRAAFAAFLRIPAYLRVALHGALLSDAMLASPAAAASMLRSKRHRSALYNVAEHFPHPGV